MKSNFRLTEDDIKNTELYNKTRHLYIANFLSDFLVNKLKLLKGPLHTVQCPEHGHECYTVSNLCNKHWHAACLGHTFGDWENHFTIYCNATLKCEKEFFIGYTFYCLNNDLISVLKQFDNLPDKDFVKGKIFNNSSRLTVFTGYMRNNFSQVSSCFFDLDDEIDDH